MYSMAPQAPDQRPASQQHCCVLPAPPGALQHAQPDAGAQHGVTGQLSMLCCGCASICPHSHGVGDAAGCAGCRKFKP
jgi:hypothetical protein